MNNTGDTAVAGRGLARCDHGIAGVVADAFAGEGILTLGDAGIDFEYEYAFVEQITRLFPLTVNFLGAICGLLVKHGRITRGNDTVDVLMAYQSELIGVQFEATLNGSDVTAVRRRTLEVVNTDTVRRDFYGLLSAVGLNIDAGDK